jgi:hypothetical protein
MHRIASFFVPVIALGGALSDGCGNSPMVENASPTTTSSSTGAATLPCLTECIDHQPPLSGDIPCDVWQVLHKTPLASGGCQGCHSDPPQHSAPFPLVTYAQLQQVYGTTQIRRYQEMCVQIQPPGSAFPLGKDVFKSIPHMPPLPNAPQLSDADLKTLNDWFDACAPPAPEGSLSAPAPDGGPACCVPQTCVELGVTCGKSAWNGCAGTVDCDNGIKDATETDVDCGGSAKTCHTRCGPGMACNTNTDCDPMKGLVCGADKRCH